MLKLFCGIIIFFITLDAQGQDTTKSVNFGLRYSYVYNYKVMHHTPALTLALGLHNFYLGFQWTTLLKPYYSNTASNIYEKESRGINLGYRYLLGQKKIRPFFQFNYAIYNLRYTEYQKGPPFSTKHKVFILENTVSFGADVSFLKRFHSFVGIGFGSPAGFFLFPDAFIPTSYVGIEYRFYK